MTDAVPSEMRAAVDDTYGSPDCLRVEWVPVPTPGDGQVLVRVAATSVNLSDWECLAGAPDNDRVLVNGAGGGSGSFAVQLAKLAGAHVTTVDNANKLDHLRRLGADEVLDYRVRDPMPPDGRDDLVLDLAARRSSRVYRRTLAPGGRYRCVGGSVRTLLGVMAAGAVTGRVTGRRLGMLFVREGPEHFAQFGERCARGEIDVHVDHTCPLDDVADALAAVGGGRALGKVVVEPGR